MVFIDEKRFNRDGVDGLRSYWHDLRKEKLMVSKRQHSGNGIMIWAAFRGSGRTKIVLVRCWLNG